VVFQECLPNPEKQLLLRQLKMTTEKKFPPELRIFALTLHFYSTSAYNYVRKSFNNCLPHPNTIRKWYSSIDGSPGYTSESLNAIKMKVEELKNEQKNLICALIMDEMSIRQHVQWNGKRSLGYVSFGYNNIESDCLPLAREALVFLIVGVNCRWKIPIGYFLIDSLTANQKADLVKGCLSMLNETGVKIISLTFDGAPANLTMAKILGADFRLSSLKSFFLHPQTKEEIFILLDPCHVIKLLRNALADWGGFHDKDEKEILWQYFKDLVKLQEDEELHLATKIRRRHINYCTEKMKVKLAVQVFSSSVADAIEYCDLDLKHPSFRNTAGTVNFCRTIDKLFDILNTRNSLSKSPFKKPLSEVNISSTKAFFAEAKNYILNLKNLSGEKMVLSKRKTGFIGLIINMLSVESIVEKYIIEKKYFNYLLTYKLSQDHIETFFCAIRSKGGFNNNPTASQFEAAYKRLLIHAEITSKSTANCLPQDDTYILNVASTDPKKIVSNDNNIDNLLIEEEFDIDGLLFNYRISEYTNDVITYICGYIARKLKNKINCAECSSQLVDENSVSKLISRKDRGGLIKPSVSVIEICKIAEMIFKSNNNFAGNVLLRLSYLTKKYIDIIYIIYILYIFFFIFFFFYFLFFIIFLH
jgi:hypothetical protein